MDRKDFHSIGLILLALILGIGRVANAQNLVPNPSFEEYTDCPSTGGQIERAIGWNRIGALVSYFNSCGTSDYGVPSNVTGFAYAFSGEAYAYVPVWGLNVTNGRGFVEMELSQTLSPMVEYHAGLHLTMADSIWYATKNFGIHLSSQPHSNDISDLLGLNPQVKYSDSTFLDNKIEWINLSGKFVAQGDERYLAIGNFDPDSTTDTTFVLGGGGDVLHSQGFWEESGYFIDGVFLVPDSIYLSNNDIERDGLGVELYPNPNNGQFNVQLSLADEEVAHLEVFNVAGMRIHGEVLNSGLNTVQLQVAEGLYLYRVAVNEQMKWTGKISVTSGQ